jgi:hypothetical protein
LKKGPGPLLQIVEVLNQNDSAHVAEAFSQAILFLWVQLPDINPTKVIFVKEKLPDGIILFPVAIAPSLNMSRPSAKTTNPFT